MKTAIIKQELLLMITPFSQKELCKNNAPKNFRNQTYADKLEEACWDGLLDELLKDIIEKQLPKKDFASGIHNKEHLFLSLSYAMIRSLQKDIYQ